MQARSDQDVCVCVCLRRLHEGGASRTDGVDCNAGGRVRAAVEGSDWGRARERGSKAIKAPGCAGRDDVLITGTACWECAGIQPQTAGPGSVAAGTGAGWRVFEQTKQSRGTTGPCSSSTHTHTHTHTARKIRRHEQHQHQLQASMQASHGPRPPSASASPPVRQKEPTTALTPIRRSTTHRDWEPRINTRDIN